MENPNKDYYSILGVAPSASQAQIKKMYRKLSKKYHADVNNQDSDLDQWAHQMMTDLNEAYEVLSNPSKRAQYDQLRKEEPIAEEEIYIQNWSEGQHLLLDRIRIFETEVLQIAGTNDITEEAREIITNNIKQYLRLGVPSTYTTTYLDVATQNILADAIYRDEDKIRVGMTIIGTTIITALIGLYHGLTEEFSTGRSVLLTTISYGVAGFFVFSLFIFPYRWVVRKFNIKLPKFVGWGLPIVIGLIVALGSFSTGFEASDNSSTSSDESAAVESSSQSETEEKVPAPLPAPKQITLASFKYIERDNGRWEQWPNKWASYRSLGQNNTIMRVQKSNSDAYIINLVFNGEDNHKIEARYDSEMTKQIRDSWNNQNLSCYKYNFGDYIYTNNIHLSEIIDSPRTWGARKNAQIYFWEHSNDFAMVFR